MPCGCNKGAASHSQSQSAFQSMAYQSSEDRTPPAPGTQLPGDVLARFLIEQGMPVGPISGRQYPLMLRNEEWWVNAEDAAVRPNWWSLVNVPEPA